MQFSLYLFYKMNKSFLRKVLDFLFVKEGVLWNVWKANYLLRKMSVSGLGSLGKKCFLGGEKFINLKERSWDRKKNTKENVWTVRKFSTPSITGHWARPNSRQGLGHQLKKRDSQDVRDISKEGTVSYHDSMDDPWCRSDWSWTNDSVGDVLEVFSISDPGHNVSWSRRTYQITDKYVRVWSPLDMNCFKVHGLFEHEGYSLKIHSWSVGQYQATIAIRYVAWMYEQAPEHVFQPLAFVNKKYFICPQHM